MPLSSVSSINTYNPKIHHLHVIQEGENPDILAATHKSDLRQLIEDNPGASFLPGDMIKIQINSSELA